jgi:hypothetical protein
LKRIYLPTLTVFVVPSLLINNFSTFLTFKLGTLAPTFMYFGALYAALKYYKYLTTSTIPKSTLVQTLRLTDSTLLINDKINLNLNSSRIHLIDGDFRRESLYVIHDTANKTYVMPLNKNCTANVKALNNLIHSKSGYEEYSIKDVLALGNDKLIDTNKTKTMKNELDTLARINLLHSRQVDLLNLSVRELHEKLNSLPDSEVKEYLENVGKGLTSNQLSLETNLVAVENLLTSFGIEREEAVAMTQSLRRKFSINNVNDLATMSKENLRDSFNDSVSKSNLNFNALYKNIETFFESLNK